jgi:dipeptidase
VFTLAAPSLLPIFSPFTDEMATYGYGPDGTSPYPFSVKPDKKLKITDVMAMARDQLEGTQFDLTAGTGKFAS